MDRKLGYIPPVSLTVLCAVLLLSCAGQAPPSGGPPDTDPPTIISVYPMPSQLHVQDSRIAFEFDEYVDHRSFEESVFISPPVGQLQFDWSGTEVEIRFPDPLRSNTTYVVNVGTDVADIRNRNRMAEAFSLAFSTGGTIDPGAIAGRVYTASPADALPGIMVFAYKLDTLDPDTLNPKTVRPDYVTQTGTNGDFFLSHLSVGSYRVLAVRDEYKNLLYDPETDEFAAASRDILLGGDDSLVVGVTMKLMREDTTAPRLIKITPVNRRILLLELSEPADTGSVTVGNFILADTVIRRPLSIGTIAAKSPKRHEFFLVSEEQAPSTPYDLTISSLRDLSGREISSSASTLRFTSSDVRDTLQPFVDSFSLSDSARNVVLRPWLEVHLSEPVRFTPWESMIELRDSLDRRISVTGHWPNTATMVVQPLQDLMGLAWYHLLVKTGFLVDQEGNKGTDTLRILNFQTLDADRLSSISGIVYDNNRTDTSGSVVVSAVLVGRSNTPPRSVSIPRPGPFQLLALPEGQYILQAFRDRNENGVYDAGRLYPFSISERFLVAGDTLKLRARWPLEQVVLRLK